MSQQITLKASGIYSYPSSYVAVPEGALALADNVVIDKDNTIEPHRGFTYLDHGGVKSQYSDPSYRADAIFYYQNQILSHYGNSFLAHHNSSTGWVNYAGSFLQPNATTKMRSAQANQNFYFSTSLGVYLLDSYLGTPSLAGPPKGLDAQVAAGTTGGWLANTFSCAYRILWGIKDANGNVKKGSPSASISFTNSSGSALNLVVTATIPAGITTAHFYQLYRSIQVSGTPSDELGLVYEGNPLSGDLSAGLITITDITPDSLRGESLYTNQSQEGLANSNEPIPFAQDLAVFKNCLFYANTSSNQSFFLTMTGLGSPNGIVSGDTLTIGGIVYTAGSSENISTRTFAISSTGTVAVDIRITCQSLVRVINRASTSIVYAYYLSGPLDLPGKLLIQSRTVGAVAFTAVSSRATWSNPHLPSSGSTSLNTSTNNAQKNYVYFSKESQPEAVPLGNYEAMGSADKAILRILALRDSLFVLKEDGIFRMYGDAGDFSVSPLDLTTILISPESARVLNNQIFAHTTQGIVSIDETGVKIMSHPIEGEITSLIGKNYALLQASSFGISYESARAYYFFCLTNAGDAGPTQYWRFNTITNTWTHGTLSKTCGAVDPFDDRLKLGNATTNIVDVERKSGNYSDYANYQSTEMITGVSGTTVSISSSDTILVGSIIYQSSTIFGTVTATNPILGTVETTLPVAFVNGAADVLAPISTRVKWLPVTFGNPGITKQMREMSILFKADFNGTASVTFSTDVNPSSSSETLQGGNVGGWGLFAWGGTSETLLGVPWGGDNRNRPIRIYIPRNHQRNTYINLAFSHSYAYSPWQINGVSIIGNEISERVGI